MERRLERWRSALEAKGLKISRKKTEYMVCNANSLGANIHLQGEVVKNIECFKYPRSLLQSDRELNGEVNSRIQAGWKNWRKVTRGLV